MNRQPTDKQIQTAYAAAKERYAMLGVDTDAALDTLSGISISLHCWQGDDVGGFESPDAELGGGLAATGNYPGKARNANELRGDLDKAYSLIPGTHRLNLHAIYAETGGRKVERNALLPEHFAAWVDWARENGHGIDFNPTCFSHPLAASGFTLASCDEGIRNFWIEHCIACRKIGAYIGRELGSPCVTNVWIPDGFKDTPVDRRTPRLLLKESLDAILAEKLDPRCNLDSVESKLFGLGSESYVAGSHEFYLGYALANQILLCLDSGHFHPTETISDKISAVLAFLDEILLHVSRGVRWDSDHVPVLDDEISLLMQEVVRSGALGRVHLALDFFDASIDRVGAWVIGARSVRKALLLALLEPHDRLKQMEEAGDGFARLALMEEAKTLPFGAVWEHYCATAGVPTGEALRDAVRAHARDVTSKR